MAFTTGLGATLGLALESTYGTFVSPNRFFEFEGSPMKGEQHYISKPQLGASTLFLRGKRYLPTTKGATGTTTMQVSSEGFGTLLNLLHSATPTIAKQAATSVYLQTHPIGLTDPNRSVTLQLGIPKSDGSGLEPFTYLGCVVTSFDVSIGVDGLAECSVGWNGRNELRTETYKTPTLPANLESFTFQNAELKINGSAVEFTKDLKLAFSIPREERWYLGSGGLKAKPVQNAFGDIMIDMTNDYGANTIFDYFVKGERKSVEIIFKGEKLESTYYSELKLTMPECGFDEASPQVTGPAVVSQGPKVKALYNGSEAPLTATYQSLDKEV
jgi:hypothetical protein